MQVWHFLRGWRGVVVGDEFREGFPRRVDRMRDGKVVTSLKVVVPPSLKPTIKKP